MHADASAYHVFQYATVECVIQHTDLQHLTSSSLIRFHPNISIDVYPREHLVVPDTIRNSIRNITMLPQASLFYLFDAVCPIVARYPITFDLSGLALGNFDVRACMLKLKTDSYMASTVNLSQNFITDDGVRYIVEAIMLNRISTLNLSHNRRLTSAGTMLLLQSLTAHQSLASLKLSGNHFGSLEADTFFLRGTSLTSLHVADMQMDATLWIRFFDELADNRTIKDLNVSRNRYGNTDVAQSIANCLRKNKSITHFNASFTYMVEASSALVLHALCDNTTIQQVNLSENDLNTEATVWTTELMKRNRSIVDLNLSRCGLSNIDGFADALVSNENLTRLDFAGNYMSTICVQSFARVLSHNKTLTYLDLGDTSLMSVAVSVLCAEMCCNTTIKTLMLNSTHFSMDYGPLNVALKNMLRFNTSLERLNLESNTIRPDHMHGIIQELHVNKTLRVVFLGNNMLGDEFALLNDIWDLYAVRKNIEIRLDGNHLSADILKRLRRGRGDSGLPSLFLS